MTDEMKLTDLFLEGTPEREVMEALLMEIEDSTVLDTYGMGAADTLRWLLGMSPMDSEDDEDEYKFAIYLDFLSGGGNGMSWE